MTFAEITDDFFLHHFLILLIGFSLDLLLGDPHSFPHPVRFMGNLISFLEKKLLKKNDGPYKQRFKGLVLVFILITLTGGLSLFLLFIAKKIHIILFLALESIMAYQCLAARSLCQESMKVYSALKKKNLDSARKALSMIVGRDTDILDEEGIAKAAVETVAENTSDGVLAPIIYMIFFGSVGGMIYKAINTMDSMIAYKNEKYINFGSAAARADDVANFIPSRICALLMIFSSFVLPGFSGKNALKIFIRDRYKHASPNSAQTESVMAGALGIRLAGDTVYDGVIEKKEYIGDKKREIRNADIKKANILMYLTSLMPLLICAVLFFW